jgi:hypothetical protein
MENKFAFPPTISEVAAERPPHAQHVSIFYITEM